jgi:NhaA family Na+:H+ antiporter
MQPPTEHIEIESRLDRILRPFEVFAKVEASGAILLLFSAITAIAWANSPWADAYATLWQTPLKLGLGDFTYSKPLLFWINDGLMTIFFFVVGLEIKREVLVGELASLSNAALPMVAALGGMVAPALIYTAFNEGTIGAKGWGIPMATDIAFALGILMLFGKRVPVSLKVFLTALAIVDDLGAVLVIAFFYTANLSFAGVAIAAVLFVLLITMNIAGARRPVVYIVLGVALWSAFLQSGIHPTISGVLLALTIPSRAYLDTDRFLAKSRGLLNEFQKAGHSGEDEFITEKHQAALQALKTAAVHVQTPMERLEHTLHHWMSYAIIPIFALANAGVTLSGQAMSGALHPVSVGIVTGLVLGKQLGIMTSVWVALKIGLVTLPSNVTWWQIYGVSWLAGIGFTMSLFISELAFGDEALLHIAKFAVLTASIIAGTIGSIVLWSASKSNALDVQAI